MNPSLLAYQLTDQITDYLSKSWNPLGTARGEIALMVERVMVRHRTQVLLSMAQELKLQANTELPATARTMKYCAILIERIAKNLPLPE